MSNDIDTLDRLFNFFTIKVPQYQRSYSWDAKIHVKTFIEDLKQQVNAIKNSKDKTYFLGTFLLHDVGDDIIHIVDGQQRLTTSVIIISAALSRNKVANIFSSKNINCKMLESNYIYDERTERQKFCTIVEDQPFFQSYILKLTNEQTSPASPSSRRLKEAYDFILSNVDDDMWGDLVHVLITAKIMFYSVKTPADATLIFELQNDRGKRLTDLEALKSYLMHLVYLNSKNPDQVLLEIQTQFSDIYRKIENIDNSGTGWPSEDAILSSHCAAFLDWSNAEWRQPKDMIKTIIMGKDRESTTRWISNFVTSLHESYKNIETISTKLDEYVELSELFCLQRMGTFWPLILKTYKYDPTETKSNFNLSCRLMELYAFRGYGIAGLRVDAGLSSLHREARDFMGDFDRLNLELYKMSLDHHDIKSRWENGLNREKLYTNNRKDVQYLLWRYENHLRSKVGQQVHNITWKQYLNTKDVAKSLSIEHIAAQNNPIADKIVYWDDGSPELFSDVALHRLGNLVLDSRSANSSKGKYDFSDKLESLSENSTFLSQGELKAFATHDENGIHWTVESIKKRHDKLLNFAIENWNPDKYFNPVHNHKIENDTEDDFSN